VSFGTISACAKMRSFRLAGRLQRHRMSPGSSLAGEPKRKSVPDLGTGERAASS
jgi:hypothetical protein